MRHLEENLQQMCVTWFRLQYPHLILIHVPNGGKRNIREAARFKRLGVTAGFPDLALFYPANGFHALFIEMKSEKGTLSASQKEMIEKLASLGYKCEVINSIELFIKIVENYLKS